MPNKTKEGHRALYYRRKADPIKFERMHARVVLRRAVTAGKIKRLPCEVCGASKVEGHHDDYSKPFEVRWLCNPHHRAVHNGAAS